MLVRGPENEGGVLIILILQIHTVLSIINLILYKQFLKT